MCCNALCVPVEGGVKMCTNDAPSTRVHYLAMKTRATAKRAGRQMQLMEAHVLRWWCRPQGTPRVPPQWGTVGVGAGRWEPPPLPHAHCDHRSGAPDLTACDQHTIRAAQ